MTEITTPRHARSLSRNTTFFVVFLAWAAAMTLLAVPLVTPAHGSAIGGEAAVKTHKHRSHGPRVGGHVRSAWPATGRKPRRRLARWMARQVGSTKPQPCAKHRRKARRRCHLNRQTKGHRRTRSAAMSTVRGDPGSPPGSVARIAASAAAATGSATASASAPTTPLQLVRSYELPADDPSYKRLLNWSWTYDSAVAAAAFASAGNKANSAQLLDQLAALQHTDGSIELAFNVATGRARRSRAPARSLGSDWPRRPTTKVLASTATSTLNRRQPTTCSR